MDTYFYYAEIYEMDVVTTMSGIWSAESPWIAMEEVIDLVKEEFPGKGVRITRFNKV